MEEVKLAIKPFYQKREVTKEEYKDILRKAVQKVGCGHLCPCWGTLRSWAAWPCRRQVTAYSCQYRLSGVRSTAWAWPVGPCPG